LTIDNTKKAIVIGAGTNGLSAAITLARAGLDVTIYEKNEVIGGACRSLELIKEGVVHDAGSAVHPMVLASPFFQSLPLSEYGLKLITSPAVMAHPLDDGTAVIVYKSIEQTSSNIGGTDAKAYLKLMTPMVERFQILINEIMQFPKIPLRHPFLMLNFGRRALLPAKWLAESSFKGARARAVFAGMGAHSVMGLEQVASSASGFMLTLAAHANGWPIPEGGAQKITDAMAGYFKALGGNIISGCEVKNFEQLPAHEILMIDVTPMQFSKIAASQLPDTYKKKLDKYQYGPGVFKMDWILNSPIPWKAIECNKAATVHIGGCMEDIVNAEKEVHAGRPPEKPFVFLVQPSLFDDKRARNSEQVVWGYCHVPNGSIFDMTGRIESQIERFAPGFKERIIARHVMYPSDMESDNANCIGGDITGGAQSLKKLVLPSISYKTPLKNVFMCSSSTPPSAGVHGMCGYRAALAAIRTIR
jgi:phytoene dehydrogenase-like protein